MLPCLIVVSFLLPLINANGDRGQRPFDNGHGWDIRLAVPGQPGNDYPTLNTIPRTSFTCSGKDPGYYADTETNCQVFRVCTLGSTYGFQSFICPNGTLFNQEVFVCDWWMNVNCQKSRKVVNKDNNKFINLKLGSQFMNDIKKMITHPMRNPYDRSHVKSNLIYMQVYKPPSGQLYNEPFGRLEQNTNDIYLNKNQPLKSFQDIFTTDTTFAASTPSTQYISNYIFQDQLQKLPYLQSNNVDSIQNQTINLVSNAHSGQTSQIKSQDFVKKQNKQIYNSPDYRHITSQFDINNNNLIKKNKQTTFGFEISKQQLNRNINNEKQSYSHTPIGMIETKQNLVSRDTPPKIITKTLAFRKIIKDPKSGTPKSRITFKTWIARPSKSAKLKNESPSYPYNNVNNDNDKLNDQNFKSSTESYMYNTPKISSIDIISTVKELPDIISSTTPSSIYSSLSTVSPTKESLIYVAPTTLNPLSFTYLPPNTYAQKISRQYILPDIANDRLVAAGSSPTPFYQVPLENDERKFSLSKQSLVNANHNNISFSDILTKEKLDISVNNIVKDTNYVLQTASPELIAQFEEDSQTKNSPIKNYLPPESSPQSGEKLILQPPSPLPKNSRLIATPSTNLEPPVEDFFNNFKQNSNPLSNLPYIKESPLQRNTIERMVSLKITLPENIAKYLFENHYGNETNNLEIINTENSDYLVLTNKLSENGGANIIPIGKLIKSKNSNGISDSQDLVFSFLADSINKAKTYNSIAQQNILAPTATQSNFQNVKNFKSEQISQGLSRVTPSHVTRTNFSDYYRSANIIKTSTDVTLKQNPSYYKNSTTLTQNRHTKASQQNISPSQTGTRNQINTINSDKIYSGQLYQLPVPIVSKQIYNSPIPSISNYILSTSLLPTNPQLDTKQKYNQRNEFNDILQSNDDIEIIPSQIIPTTAFDSVTNQNHAKIDQGSDANGFIENFRIPINGIRAQVEDNIVGTLSHPIDENKLIKYKKNHSYYIYSNVNNNYDVSNDAIKSNIANTIDSYQASRENKVNNALMFQVVPSLGYKLEDEKEKQNILNIFQIKDLVNPKQNALYSQRNANNNRKQDISTDIEYTVNHPTSFKSDRNSSQLSALYDGPSSYSASQSSVGNLENTHAQSVSKYNSKIEKFDTFDDENGYPRIRPIKKFVF